MVYPWCCGSVARTGLDAPGPHGTKIDQLSATSRVCPTAMDLAGLGWTALMPRYGTSHGCRCTRTSLGAPPTPRFGVSEAKLQTPGAKMCRGNEMGCLTS